MIFWRNAAISVPNVVSRSSSRHVEREVLPALITCHEAVTAPVGDQRHDRKRADPEAANDLLGNDLVAAGRLDVDSPADSSGALERAEAANGKRSRKRALVGRRQPVCNKGKQHPRLRNEADDAHPLEAEPERDRCPARPLQDRPRPIVAAGKHTSKAVESAELDMRLRSNDATLTTNRKSGPQYSNAVYNRRSPQRLACERPPWCARCSGTVASGAAGRTRSAAGSVDRVWVARKPVGMSCWRLRSVRAAATRSGGCFPTGAAGSIDARQESIFRTQRRSGRERRQVVRRKADRQEGATLLQKAHSRLSTRLRRRAATEEPGDGVR